jgi:histidyl-tRNA synthetase
MLIRRQIETALRSKAEHFGYSEVATPTFELAELFLRKSGPGILEQIYMFKDKGDRELMLRPELTAPVIRFYANELYKYPKPLKVFYVGNCFRYERPQKGRFREFWQFGAELIGTNKPEGIAELIAFARACMIQASLKNFVLRIGHIQILKKILTSWKVNSDLQGKIMTMIDKGDVDSLQNLLMDEGLDNREISAFSEMVANKFPVDDFDAQTGQLIDSFPSIEGELDRLHSVLNFLNTFGITCAIAWCGKTGLWWRRIFA